MRHTKHICLFLALAALCGAQQPEAPKQAHGFRFLYADKQTPAQYLPANPCVSGGWRFVRETDTHWIGELHYPTGNVAPTYPNDNEAAFVVRPIKVAKSKDLGVNLKDWSGQVILRQADAKVRFGSEASLQSTFHLIGVEIEKGKGTTFLFKNVKGLAYAPGGTGK